MQTGNKPLGPDDASDPEARWWWVLGHATPWVMCLLWAVMTVARLFDWWWVGTAAILAFPVLLVSQMRHEFQPVCIRCMREQPEDGGQVAQRRIFHLWVRHLPAVGGILGRVLLFAVAFAIWVCADFWPGTPLGAVMIVLGGGGISYDWWLEYNHRKLKPWCPWCKDPGDDPDPVPERDPDPSMTKQG